MAIRVLNPSRRWSRLVWPTDVALTDAEKLALSAVDVIPGCEVSMEHGWCDIPFTAWELECVRTLYELLQMDAPVMARIEQAPLWSLVPGLTRLYKHQADALQSVCEGAGSALIADEMGCGKTAEAIAIAESYRRQLQRPVLIVGPKFTRAVWLRELAAMGCLSAPEDFCYLESRDFDNAAFRADAHYYFCHYDIIRAWWPMLHLRLGKLACLIVDEAHWVRNSRAQRAKGTLMVTGLTEHRVLLTGTPVEQRPADLWNLLTLTTGPRTWGGPLKFRQRYSGAYHDGFAWQDGEPTHMDELKARMQPFYLRRTAEEVGINLPALRRECQVVELRPQEQEQHDAYMTRFDPEQLMEALLSHSLSEEVLQALNWLRRLTSVGKILATVEYVENLWEQGERVVVFTWEREIAGALQKRLSNAVVCHGGLSQEHRDNIVKEFQANEGPRVLVATLDCLREGVDLWAARIVVFHDLDWTLSRMLQGEARIHRIGQWRACQSIWMVAKGSIDAIVARCLMAKAHAQNRVLGADAGAIAMNELNLEEALGVMSTEDRVAASIERWSAGVGR